MNFIKNLLFITLMLSALGIIGLKGYEYYRHTIPVVEDGECLKLPIKGWNGEPVVIKVLENDRFEGTCLTEMSQFGEKKRIRSGFQELKDLGAEKADCSATY